MMQQLAHSPANQQLGVRLAGCQPRATQHAAPVRCCLPGKARSFAARQTRQRLSLAPLRCHAQPDEHAERCQQAEEAALTVEEQQPAAPPAERKLRWMPASALRGASCLQTPLVAGLAAAVGIAGTGYDVSGPGSIAQAILVIGAIVAFHELGHFTAAKSQGIHVTKFSVGFGPSLYSYQGKEVEYSLRAIPLGGFVGFPDDDPDSKFEPDDPGLLRNKSIPQRLLVVSAGIIANLILAYTVLLAQVGVTGTPQLDYLPGVLVPQVLERSAARKAGIQPGDIILGINGQALTPSKANVARIVSIIRDSPGLEVELTIQRGADATPFVMKVTPDLSPRDNGGLIGVKLGAHANVVRDYAKSPIDALRKAGLEFARLGGQITSGLQQIVTNFGNVQDKISGPVAIVAVGADVARTDSSGLFQFAALINLNLAVVNALPLPGLDGGYLVLLALEAARGKKLDQMVEKSILGAGVLLLTGAGIFLVLRDALNLAGR